MLQEQQGAGCWHDGVYKMTKQCDLADVRTASSWEGAVRDVEFAEKEESADYTQSVCSSCVCASGVKKLINWNTSRAIQFNLEEDLRVTLTVALTLSTLKNARGAHTTS